MRCWKSYILIFGLIAFLHIKSAAQQTLTTINGWNAYVHLPPDYYTSTKLYPVIVFMPGLGEVGNNPADLLVNGPARFIAQGHKMEFMVNGILQTPIVISMQPPAAWPAPLYLNRQLDSIFRRWRIDPNRLALTGLSMGGSGWDNYVPANPAYWLRPASIVAMSAPPPATPVENFSFYAQSGGRWWGFEGTSDYRQMDVIRDIMNEAVPGSARYTKYNGGHCCWNTWYDPAYNENGESIYTWMLKQTRNPSALPNQAPVANAGYDQDISLPENTATLNGTATDADGTIIGTQWTQISGPSNSTITNPTSLQTTITNLTEGVYQFQLAIADNIWTLRYDTITITVYAGGAPPPPPNQPPVANGGSNQTITLPTNSVTLNGIGTDSDGSITSYSWSKIAGPTQFTITNASSAQTTVTNLVQGVYQFRFAVTDDKGATAADTVSITVNAIAPPPVNQLPVANAGINQTITLPTSSVTLTGSGTDSDGSITSYSWSKIAGPTQFTITTATSAQTTVTGLVQGVYQFRLTVTDNLGASASATVTITVNAIAPPPVNQLPVANAGSNQTITLPTSSVTLTGSGTDSDGSISSYSWSKIAGPTQFTITTATSAQTTVTGLVQGVYQFRLTVMDNQGSSASATVTITVNPAPLPGNQSPVANAGGNQIITLPINSVTLRGSGTDSDGSIASYNWSKASGPTQFTITTATSAQTTVTGLVQGVYQFRLTVMDNQGASASATVNVIVNPAPLPVNQLPVADAGSDKSISLPTNTIVLQGAGFDPDGSIVAYQWREITNDPQYQLTDANTSRCTVSNLAEGNYLFELQVTDNNGAKDTDTVALVVKDLEASKVGIFPNPTTGIFTINIEAKTMSNLTPVVIYDAAGNTVYQETFVRTSNNISKQIDITSFPAGIYFIEIAADINKKVTVKMVKQ